MKNTCGFVSIILILSLIIVPILGGCTPAETSRLKVVTSTYLIASIVERVGGNMVEVVNIIPPARHPGDFDTKPGDIQKLADADLFLLHGWPGEKFVPNLIASANNADLTVVRIEIEGNWMIPPVQLEATEKITAALSQVDNKNSPAYQKSMAEYKGKIVAKETEIKAKLAEGNLSEVNVICASWQAGFVTWTGFNVVATYGNLDSLTPKVVKELVDKGREAEVALIIDNLQSGKDAGKGIAEELGGKRVILSNFPGGFDNTETWEKAIDWNIELLLETIAQ
jgi:zinc transport system substrate-binding protein